MSRQAINSFAAYCANQEEGPLRALIREAQSATDDYSDQLMGRIRSPSPKLTGDPEGRIDKAWRALEDFAAKLDGAGPWIDRHKFPRGGAK